MSSKPAPKCSLCSKYASHGPKCGHVDCPCRKSVTAQVKSGSVMTGSSSSTTRVQPSVRTTREYD